MHKMRQRFLFGVLYEQDDASRYAVKRKLTREDVYT